MKLKKQKGFTLLEIMIVVIILGMLATLVIQSVGDRPDQARAVKVKNDIVALEGAIKMYRMDTYRLPSSEQGLKALSQLPDGVNNWSGPYIDRLPKDPWGNEYRYRSPGTNGAKFDIYSYGADGVEGGTDINADIGSWNIE
jgi:general secretion pathway protein G